MTSSEDHFRAAEKFLEEAESHREPDTRAEWCLELAKVHLALAQASRVASPEPSGEYPQSGSLPGHNDPDTAEGRATHTPVHSFVDPRTPELFAQGSRLGRPPRDDSARQHRRDEAHTNPASHTSDLLRPGSEIPDIDRPGRAAAFPPIETLGRPDDEPR
jgi:hypothetical protein